jgi:hypothetical protein
MGPRIQAQNLFGASTQKSDLWEPKTKQVTFNGALFEVTHQEVDLVVLVPKPVPGIDECRAVVFGFRKPRPLLVLDLIFTLLLHKIEPVCWNMTASTANIAAAAATAAVRPMFSFFPIPCYPLSVPLRSPYIRLYRRISTIRYSPRRSTTSLYRGLLELLCQQSTPLCQASPEVVGVRNTPRRSRFPH